MTAQPLPRETSIELVDDTPVRRTRSKAATQATTQKASAKTAAKTTTKTTAKTTTKTAAKTATTRQRSATKSVAIAELSLQTPLQAVPSTHTVAADSDLDHLQHCRQFLFSNVLAESQKLTQDMEQLASIALQIQQLQRPSFDPIPLMTPRMNKRTQAAPVQTVAQPPSKVVFVSTQPIAEPIAEPIAKPIAESTVNPTAGTPAKAQRPSRTSVSRLTVRKPIPPYDPNYRRSVESARSPAVAPNYWGGNVQAPATAAETATTKASERRCDRLDLPSFGDRPAQPVLQRLAQQQPRLTLDIQPTNPTHFPIQSHAQSFTAVTIDRNIYEDVYRYIQRLVPIPTDPKAIVIDAVLWTFSSVGVQVILQVCIQTVPVLSFPLHFVMMLPALFAAYLAFYVPRSSTPPVYRCLLTTLGFFLGSKL